MGRIVLGVQEGVIEMKLPISGPESLHSAFLQLQAHKEEILRYNSWPLKTYADEALTLYNITEQRVLNTAHRLGVSDLYLGNTREKRALGALIPIITIAGQFLYKGLGILTANINPISVITSLVTSSIFTNFKISQILPGKKAYYFNEINQINNFKTECLMVLDQANTLMTSVSLAETGVFYPNIFPYQDIAKATNQFEERVENSYVKLVESPLNLYETHVQIQKDADFLIYRFSIPLMPKKFPEMCLQQYLMAPLVLPDPKMIVRLKAEKDFLAVGGHFFKSMSLSELNQCYTRRERRYCGSSIIKKGAHDCLAAISSKSQHLTLKKCDIEVITESPYVFQYSRNLFGIATTLETQYTIDCGATSTIGHVDGLKTISIKDGCELSIENIKVTPTERIHEYYNVNFTQNVFSLFLKQSDLTYQTTYDLVLNSGKNTVSIKKLAANKGFLLSTPVQLVHIATSLVVILITLIVILLFSSNYLGVRFIRFLRRLRENRTPRNQIMPPEQMQLMHLHFQWLQSQQNAIQNEQRPALESV